MLLRTIIGIGRYIVFEVYSTHQVYLLCFCVVVIVLFSFFLSQNTVLLYITHHSFVVILLSLFFLLCVIGIITCMEIITSGRKCCYLPIYVNRRYNIYGRHGNISWAVVSFCAWEVHERKKKWKEKKHSSGKSKERERVRETVKTYHVIMKKLLPSYTQFNDRKQTSKTKTTWNKMHKCMLNTLSTFRTATTKHKFASNSVCLSQRSN